MNTDRALHAKFTHEREVYHIVRYARAGKWWIEGVTSRRPVTLQQAVDAARAFDAEVFFGKPGGLRFDSALRKRSDV